MSALDRTGCWCETTRKPCPYHEGAEDALGEVEAVLDAEEAKWGSEYDETVAFGAQWAIKNLRASLLGTTEEEK